MASKSETDQKLLGAIVEEALATGASFADVFIEHKRTETLTLEDRRIGSVSSGHDVGAGVRAIADGSTGYAMTNIVDEAGLRRAAREAAASATGKGKKPPALQQRVAPVIHAAEEDPFGVPAGRKSELLMEIDDTARTAGAEIKQVICSYGQEHQDVVIANSSGTYATDARTRVRLTLTVVSARDGRIARAFDSIAGTSGYELLSGARPVELASAVAQKAISKLDAIACPAGEMPVVIGARAGGVLFHEACGHPCEADNIVKGASVYLQLEGKKVAEDFVNIVDDATAKGGWGSFAFDDEGTPAQKTYLVRDGILVNYLVDNLRSTQLGRPSTANGRRQSYEHVPIPRMSNTYLLPGGTDPGEIIRSTKRGVWVGRMGGGQVNPVTGDFVFGADEAFLIENGELTKPIRGANLIGDGPTVLSRIEVVGSDFDQVPGTCGKFGQFAHAGIGQPTLRVSKLTVGGTG